MILKGLLILNTTEISFDDKKVTFEKKYLPYSHDFIGNRMLVIIFYYTRDMNSLKAIV